MDVSGQLHGQAAFSPREIRISLACAKNQTPAIQLTAHCYIYILTVLQIYEENILQLVMEESFVSMFPFSILL
jgi:hypothetical protein